MVIKNAKRSGGPKTTEGKLVASQNSLKTGSYSNLAVLPHENSEEFNQLVSQFHHDFHPSDVIETSLVRELAVITWKKLRLEKLEQDYFTKKINAPFTLTELVDCGLKINQDRFNFWHGNNAFDADAESLARKTLDHIKPIFRIGISVEQLLEIKELNPVLYNAIVDVYRQVDPLADAEISDWEIVNKTAKFPNEPIRYITSIVFEKFITFYESGLWCLKYEDDIDQAIVKIKQERLLIIIQSDGLRRAEDDLGRSLMRTLEQFRKHNQWRMKHRVIDTEKE